MTEPASGSGRVFLVGAGPGDPELITVKGARCLAQAEVVVYDRLASPELLDLAPAAAERIFVGKGPRQHTMTQEEINQVLVDRAERGRVVVRLKGGDPYVFGRGGEEALALFERGLAFEVVPGISSAVAGPASAGIPVTHRAVATSFAVVTGHEDPLKATSGVDWARVACAADTLVFVMGVERLSEIVAALVANGRSAETPAALVRWATTPRQEVVDGTLATIVERAAAARMGAPAVFVVGEVVRLRDRLDWRSALPLAGLRVLVTRARHQASQLSRRLSVLGAVPLEFPTIEIQPVEDLAPLDSAIARLSDFAWVIFTSTNGVDAFFDRLAVVGGDTRKLAHSRVCAVGPATAERLAEHGIRADRLPERFLTEAIVAAFDPAELAGVEVLLARADIAPPLLAEELTRLGARVRDVVAYRTVVAADSQGAIRDRIQSGEVDLITLTSSSTARNLLAALDGDSGLLRHVVVASIGPVTSATARELGLRVEIEASEHTIPGLVAAIESWRRKATAAAT
ncbi:MAG: uroporphyrinogen-III C-methyltransferase [Chloroflexota bacterium]